MAALKKVPTPKPKDDFWVEEYRKERSKSPMVDVNTFKSNEQSSTMNGNNEHHLPEPVQNINKNQVESKIESPVKFDAVANLRRQMSQKENENNNSSADQNNNVYTNATPTSPQQRIYSPFSSSPLPSLPKPLSPVKLNQDENVPIYVRSFQRNASPAPQVPDGNRSAQPSQVRQSPAPFLQKQPSLEQQQQPYASQTPVYTRPSRNTAASPVVHSQPNLPDPQAENVPIYVRSFQKQPAQPSPLSTAHQTYNSEPGRQYYQPNHVTSPPVQQQPQQQQQSNQSPLANQQMPPWMRRANSKEVPEWATNHESENVNGTRAQNNQYEQSMPSSVNTSSEPTQNYAGPKVKSSTI